MLRTDSFRFFFSDERADLRVRARVRALFPEITARAATTSEAFPTKAEDHPSDSDTGRRYRLGHGCCDSGKTDPYPNAHLITLPTPARTGLDTVWVSECDRPSVLRDGTVIPPSSGIVPTGECTELRASHPQQQT
jgi:hypothetical protein